MTSLRNLSAALALVLASAQLPAADAERRAPRGVIAVDRIVAVVNDEVITRVDLQQQLSLAIDTLKRRGTPAPPPDILERQVLEQMISQRMQLQLARESGMRIEEGVLDKTITRIAQQNKLSVEQLREALQRDGVPFTRFREDIRNELLITRLREREVDSKIVVTEQEIDAFIQNASKLEGKGNEYSLGHILVRVPEQANAETIQLRQARAEQALAQLRQGADFGQVSATFSDAPEALQGGSLGWREASRLPTLFLDALVGMKVGQVSGLLRSSNGFHILKLLDQRGAAPVIVQQTQARHILVRTNEVISESEARNRLVALRERIENGASFAELARLQSQDASAPKGGDLGWLSPGDTVPEFERTMNQLKIGELSQPIRTEFGWHLVQVLARREEDMSKERSRLTARQSLRERKSDEAYQEWLRQLRDKTYVEIRVDER